MLPEQYIKLHIMYSGNTKMIITEFNKLHWS